MLYRKIEQEIKAHLKSDSDKILVIEGARQIGKSYIIREVGRRLFKNYIEINFVLDDEGEQLYKNIHTKENFYLALGMKHGGKLGEYDDTLVFLDEIQQYPQYLTLLKFFREDRRFHFIASGNLLGVTLKKTTSIPIGSIIRKRMTPLDFEEFTIANGMRKAVIEMFRLKYNVKESLTEELHNYMLNMFRRYLLVGGMPDAVNEYLASHNIVKVREVQENIRSLYGDGATKYENDYHKKLLVRRIYEMIPSQMENKKKRIVAKDIRDKKGDRFEQYQDEFEYLISSGITLCAHAISNPRYPLTESVHKNLLKLYMNDVGMLTSQLYHHNIRPIMEDIRSINLGSVYENVVAQELYAHGHQCFYYDNRNNGEVDFLVDDYNSLSILPIEVKSGKDYAVYSALGKLMSIPDYHINGGLVLSNEREVFTKDKVTYMPIYYIMFVDKNKTSESGIYF